MAGLGCLRLGQGEVAWVAEAQERGVILSAWLGVVDLSGGGLAAAAADRIAGQDAGAGGWPVWWEPAASGSLAPGGWVVWAGLEVRAPGGRAGQWSPGGHQWRRRWELELVLLEVVLLVAPALALAMGSTLRLLPLVPRWAE